MHAVLLGASWPLTILSACSWAFPFTVVIKFLIPPTRLGPRMPTAFD